MVSFVQSAIQTSPCNPIVGATWRKNILGWINCFARFATSPSWNATFKDTFQPVRVLPWQWLTPVKVCFGSIMSWKLVPNKYWRTVWVQLKAVEHRESPVMFWKWLLMSRVSKVCPLAGVSELVLSTSTGFSCGVCTKDFSDKSNCRRHIKEKHFGLNQLPCPFCQQIYLKRYIQGHMTSCRRAVASISDPLN